MQIVVGDVWTAWNSADLFLFTSNATIKNDGSLVMGAGFARQVKERFPGVDKKLGEAVSQAMAESGDEYYGIIISPEWPKKKLGCFQTKRHFTNAAELDIIQFSVALLKDWCWLHPSAQVALNYPGIGYGGLEEADVYPIIEYLPDSATIWKSK